jgi:membrane-associated phospholipid phosphatase
MIKKYILLSLSFCIFSISYGQKDSVNTSKKIFFKKEIIPLSLIGTGIYVNYAKGSLGKVQLQNNIQNGLNFSTRADDVLQFAPIGVLGFADVLGLKTANNIKTQAKNIVLITATNYVIVKTLKITTNETRPNGSKHSFPSGHTSQAFAMAGILRHELKDSHPVLSYSGYLFATTTGTFRVLNNKHWVSDVLVGAGVGMLVTDIFYKIQNKHQQTRKKETKITSIFVPSFKEKTVGISGILYF